MLKKTLIFSGFILIAALIIPVLIKNIKPVKEEKDIPETGSKIQCKALTASGKRCRRQSIPGSEYCWQHQI